MRLASCLIGFLATLAICNADSAADPLKHMRLEHEPPWKISVVVQLPYLQKTKTKPTKNEHFKGYIPDVLERIGEQMHHEYTIMETGDPTYGDIIPGASNWTGIIGDVMDGRADLAATPVTIRDDRLEILDFTEPLFSSRTVAILMKSPSSAMSLKELVEKTQMKFFVQQDQRIMQCIQNSTLPHFKKIAAAYTADPGLLISNAEAGINKVRNGRGKYAYITYSCKGTFWVKRQPCDLATVETRLPQSEMALAFPKGSANKERFRAAIVRLREKEELVKIRQKWWKNECSSGTLLYTWSALIGLRLLSQALAVATFLRLL